MPFNNPARVPHHTPIICYVLFHDARLYFWNRWPDYFASAREAYYESLARRNYVQLRCYCSVRILGQLSGYWAT